MPLSKLALAELLELRKNIDYHNGSLTGMSTTPMQTWAVFASSVQTAIAHDSLQRTYQEVSVRVASSTIQGGDGALHLKPAAIHNMVRSLAAFVMTHSMATW